MGADPADPAKTLTILVRNPDQTTSIWTPDGGLRLFESYVQDELGLMADIDFIYGRALSSNGTRIFVGGITGTGSNIEGVIAVPEPSTLVLIGIATACLASQRFRRGGKK
jgi:hypothetical protein